jgi:Flp pilus assembly protein TadG
MANLPSNPRRARRPGAAAVELAVLLPILMFLCVISIDFARIFYFSQTVANCARNGALYQSVEYLRQESRYARLQEAALADASNLNDPNNPPTVSDSTGTDANGKPYVEVTVKYKFKTLTNYIGVPSTVDLTRTVRMAKAPPNPQDK